MGTSRGLWLPPDWDLQLGKRRLWTEVPDDFQVRLETAGVVEDIMEEKWWEVCPHSLGTWGRESPWRDVLAELGSRGCGAGAQQSPRGLFPLLVPKSFLGPRASSLHMSLDHNCP